MKTRSLFPVVLTACCQAFLGASAADIDWTNSLGGLWSEASNWSPNRVPSTNDNVFIIQNGTYNILVDVNATVASLIVGPASGTPTIFLQTPTLTLNGPSIFRTNTVLNLNGGTLAGAGPVNLAGVLNWTAGKCSGTLTNRGVVNISGDDSKSLDGTFNNASTIIWTGSAWLCGGPVSFNNLETGLFDVQADMGSCDNFTFNNAGVLRKYANTNAVRLYWTLNNFGLVEVVHGTLQLTGRGRLEGEINIHPGAIVDISGGSYTLAGEVSGTGVFQVTLNGGVYADNALLSNLTLGRGVLAGTSTITGPMTWTDGWIQGSVINVNGGLTMTNAAGRDLFMYGSTLNNSSVVQLKGNGRLVGDYGAIFNNLAGAVLEVADGSIVDGRSSSQQPILNNAGTFRKGSGAAALSVGWVITNTGLCQVKSGSLVLAGGGNHDGRFEVEQGAVLIFSGTTNTIIGNGASVSGLGGVEVLDIVLTLNDGIEFVVPQLWLSRGGIGGAGTWTVNGRTTWLGGIMTGSGVLNAKGGLTISGNADKTLRGLTINNSGYTVWTGSGQIAADSGAVFNNLPSGYFDIQTDSRLFWFFGVKPIFHNAGVFRKSSGTGTTVCDWNFDNTGTAEVLTGTMQFLGDYQQTAGASLLKGGVLATSSTLQINGGILSGNGMVSAVVSNAGQISPGLSAGSLTISGNYTQSSGGILTVEIGGVAPGTSFDQLQVTGVAQLAGDVNVGLINGFIPRPGDSFEIMRFASHSGDLALNGLKVANGVRLEPLVTATNITLVATNAPRDPEGVLQVLRIGNALQVCWPTGFEAYVLQSATNLSPAYWETVPLNGTNCHVFEPSSQTRFFRMVGP